VLGLGAGEVEHGDQTSKPSHIVTTIFVTNCKENILTVTLSCDVYIYHGDGSTNYMIFMLLSFLPLLEEVKNCNFVNPFPTAIFTGSVSEIIFLRAPLSLNLMNSIANCFLIKLKMFFSLNLM